MTKPGEKNRFLVDLGGMSLTPADRRAIAATIQGAVLAHLAIRHPMPTDTLRLVDEGGIAGMYPAATASKPDAGPGL